MKQVQTLDEFKEAIQGRKKLSRRLPEDKSYIRVARRRDTLYMKGLFFHYQRDDNGMIQQEVYDTSAKIEDIVSRSFPFLEVEGVEVSRDYTLPKSAAKPKPQYYGMIYVVYGAEELAEILLWTQVEYEDRNLNGNRFEVPPELQKRFRFEASLPVFSDCDFVFGGIRNSFEKIRKIREVTGMWPLEYKKLTKQVVTEMWPLIDHFETQPNYAGGGFLGSGYDTIPHRRGQGSQRAIEWFENGQPQFGPKGLPGPDALLYKLGLELPKKRVHNRAWLMPPEMRGGD